MEKQKILIVDNSLAFTGAFRSILTTTTYLSNKFDFHFCLPKNSALNVKNENDCLRLPFIEIRRSTWALCAYFPMLIINSLRIHKFCKRNAIEVIHTNDLYNMCGVVLKILFPKYKIIYHIRLLPDSYVGTLFRIWAKVVYKYANIVICVSQAVRTSLPGTNKVHIIYDSMDDEAIRPITPKSITSQIKLLYLANYTRGKGHNFALHAFKLAYNKVPNISMILAGGDLGVEKNMKWKNELRQIVNHLKINDQVTLKDFVDDNESLIRNSDILLNFSESESFSMTCLEAMFFGTPVIASECGGPSELIENGKSGLLVPNRDVNAMAEAIVRLSEDEKLRTNFARDARIRAEEKFSLRKNAESLAVLYTSLFQ